MAEDCTAKAAPKQVAVQCRRLEEQVEALREQFHQLEEALSGVISPPVPQANASAPEQELVSHAHFLRAMCGQIENVSEQIKLLRQRLEL